MYYPRLLENKLQELFKNFPIVVVSGARQVGKSTLLEKVFGTRAEAVVFDPLIDVENARQDPELFLSNHKTPLILDEIQYAPEVVPALKKRIDRTKRNGLYLLTGSQQWSVIKSLSESLAGRAVFLDLDGFSLRETARAAGKPWLQRWLENPKGFVEAKKDRLKLPHSLNETLWRGSMPRTVQLPLNQVPDYFLSYQRTCIERDVRLLAEISDAQQFSRFIRIASALSAQELNFSEIGREIGITPQTAHRWLDILKATFQWVEIPAFTQNAIKRVSQKPKGYFKDTGFLCYLQAITTPNGIPSHPLWGSIFETAVIMELEKQIAVMDFKPRVSHWRSHGGAEVDFILEYEGTLFPIEVKATSRPSSKMALGLASFRQTYSRLKVGPGLIVCPAESFYPVAEDSFACPWDLK